MIAFTGLNQHSEVVAMKAAGLSAHQILAPMIVASLVHRGAACSPSTKGSSSMPTAQVTAWSDNDYKPIPPESGILSATSGSATATTWSSARHVGGRGRHSTLSGVTIYDREGGELQPSHRGRACRTSEPGAWRLSNVRIYDAAMNMVRAAAGTDRA